MKRNVIVRQKVHNLVLAAMFLALALVLPFLTGQLPKIGNMLLPMHIPILLCGLICGWQYGGVVGFVAPLMRSALFGMPVFFPSAIGMSFELAAYGVIIGFLYTHSRWQCVIALYRCLIAAMIGGRLVWGAARTIMAGVSGSSFVWEAFISGALLTAIPGIIIQLVLIPAIMVALDRTGMVHFRKSEGCRI